jgi:prepilin-type N-terminal cleavage/methylation domain-containing protein
MTSHVGHRGGAESTAELGFTLIEMLIVLAITGITVAMIRFGGGVMDRVTGNTAGNDDVQLALSRLVRSATGANERAMIRGRPIALELSTGQYRFVTLDVAGRWIPIANDPLFAERSLPNEWRWESVLRDGYAIEAPYRLFFGNEPVKFSILIATRDGRFVVSGNSLGVVDWVSR